ncbi:hypothetical protein A3F55_01565 [Candidatus Adlerbacteria bacterium RIFCSPHIGHO2_12_FULL_53_18]|uniref:Uncharacterized protein n=1 Tax=Candidatus Adlerbacteria bacterium RIFCSPHIGHO2_12_FULL_53_18 TaxID=1797242 RepID=A0A1F4XRV9_9BACT|nr:MAG: hypothetical protein A3F55_01565 [Candidatus Adlerbacteria bacterium RIFCSPHIGHO2_12_FULL_53_18]
MPHISEFSSEEEQEVIRAALNPYLLLELPVAQGYDQAFAELHDLLENEPDRDEVLAAVMRAKEYRDYVISVYRTPSKPQLYEYFVTAKNCDGKATPTILGLRENLARPLNERVFDLAWNNLEYWSLRRQLADTGPATLLLLGMICALGVGMLFGAHWAEKTFGGILLTLIGYCFWHLLIYDRREHNYHVSRVESYLRKFELLPRIFPIQRRPS